MDSTAALETDPIAGARLRDWLARHGRLLVLTGAGCSTGSGIPDYRDDAGAWKRAPPVTWQAFTGDPAAYRRYWARSSIGWPHFLRAMPNAAHHALARLGRGGTIALLVTQNVDGLHQRAGSERVVDLHGRLDEVLCLHCAARTPRAALQTRIEADNRGWRPVENAMAPDGDADIDDAAVATFVAPCCQACGGPLKPDVVFFGENVPRERYRRAHDALHAADALLVVGSSLMVYSGYRFARMAADAGLPLAILNRGATRADTLADLKLEADIGDTLTCAIA